MAPKRKRNGGSFPTFRLKKYREDLLTRREAELANERDEVLKRMLKMKPTPHKLGSKPARIKPAAQPKKPKAS